MFNLEQAIKAWRRKMSAAGIKSRETLDELESHLRDDVEQQVKAGENPQQAFETAVLRMGHAGALKAEFSKTGEPMATQRKAALRKCCWLLAALFFLCTATWHLTANINSNTRLLGLVASAMVALYLGSLPVFYGLFSIHHDRRFRIAAQAAGTLTWLAGGAAIMAGVLPRLGLANDVIAIGLWAALPTIAVCAWLAHNLETGFDRPSGGTYLPGEPKIFPPGSPLPPGKHFTPTAESAFKIANEEATQLNHDYVGTEHVLLALLKLQPATFIEILRRLDVTCEAVRAEIESLVVAGARAVAVRNLPYTPRALKAVKLAAGEAAALNHFSVGAEHMLLGLLREGSGVAALALRNLGVDCARTRQEMIRVLNPDSSHRPFES